MPNARRVLLAPPAVWPEDRLLDAARALAPERRGVRPGDELAGLVVLRVEPLPGAAMDADTALEVRPAPRATLSARIDLAILLDVSESMAERWSERHTRLDAATTALASFAERPGPHAGDVSLFHYAPDAKLVAGPRAADELRPVAPTAPGGRSATGHALDAALAHLAEREQEGRAQAIILLTDGAGDVDETLAAGERARRLGVPVHVVVFAPAVDEVFEDLARLTSGSVQRATLPLTLEFVHGETP